MSDAFLNPSRRSRSLMSGEDAVPLSRVSPGPVWPSANQLKVAYTYGIQREDGSYTQLIRADELDRYDFERVRVSQGPEGMIVLPPPEQPRPERREGPELMVPNDIIQTLPVNGVRHPPKDDDTQMQIDSIIAQAALSPVAPELSKPTRREKIYCDKWIHEGVCAFTQLGCKYKHEMPLDKATQLSLGLNHGLPVWYKRAQAVQVRPEPQSTDSPSSARTTGPWRRTTTAAPLPAGQSIRGGMQSSSAGHSSFGSSSFVTAPFGPIGPPIPVQQAQASNNPYSMLSPDTKSDDEEDPTFVWRGRGR